MRWATIAKVPVWSTWQPRDGLGSGAPGGTLKAMVREGEIRRGEMAVDWPGASDAGLVFIGRIYTPWTSRLMTPRQGRLDGPVCQIQLFDPWIPALTGLERYESVEVLYWLHLSRRDLVLQSPADDGTHPRHVRPALSLLPNPIGTSLAKLVGIEGNTILVQGLDCLDGTPSSTSSPTAAGSPRSPRRNRGISRRRRGSPSGEGKLSLMSPATRSIAALAPGTTHAISQGIHSQLRNLGSR